MTIKNGRIIWAWISMGAFFAGLIANGAVQYRKVDSNVDQIKELRMKYEQKTHKFDSLLIVISKDVKEIKEDIRELKEKQE